MDEGTSFTDMDSWKGSGDKFGLTFEQIVLMHLNRCVINGCVEWHGGYWQEKTKGNTYERYYVQNSRDVYNNSVTMLKSILIGHFDKEMTETNDRIQAQLKEAYKKVKGISRDDREASKEYFNEKIDLHIELFEALVKLAKRLNFFKEQSSEVEM